MFYVVRRNGLATTCGSIHIDSEHGGCGTGIVSRFKGTVTGEGSRLFAVRYGKTKNRHS